MYGAEGLGGYGAVTAASDFGLALTSHQHAEVDYLDAHMQQVEAHTGTDDSHSLFSKHPFATKNEAEEEARMRSATAQMLDPFGFDPASPVMQHHAQQETDAMNEPQLFKHEHSVLSEFDAVPSSEAAAASGSFLLAPIGISNAHVPMRQNATPQPPVPMMMAVPRRGAEIKIKHEILQVKQEPVSPTASYITSPQSRLSSPMPALSSPSMGDAALSPVLLGGVRSGSSAGESGSAGSGGSGSNSAAHSCASASDSESDAAFDEPEPVVASGSKPKKAAASSKSNSNKGKAGRKRKSKAGSGNSSGAEQTGTAEGSVGDEMDDAAGAPLAEGAPGETNKRQQRLQRNRASAQLSRERKKQYMRLLEKQLKELADLNEGLSVQIRALTSENTALKTRLSALSMRERVQARYPKMPAVHTSSASSSSQASTSSLQSSPMHAPAASPSGASDADALSNPASPRSVEGDVPRNAKRVKVEAYSPPHAASAGGRPAGAFSARAGLLLFTLVCSVGLLYNFASVDVAPAAKPFDLSASGAAAANVILARSLGGPAPAPSRASVTLMSEGGGGGGDEDVVVHRSHASLTATQPARGRVLASVSDDSESNNSDAFALVPLANSAASSVVAPMEIIDEGDSKALDVYTRSSASSSVSVVGGDDDSKLAASSATHLGAATASADVQLLRRLLLSAGTNSSSAASEGTNFMFCPQSLSISRDTWNGLLHKHNIVGQNYTGTPSELGDEKQVALFETEESGAGASSASSTKRSRSGKKKGTVARLRKAIGLPQLPAPGSEGSAHKIDAVDSARAAASSLLLSDLSALPAVQSGLQVGDKLLLWVPLQLSSSHSGRPNSTTAVDESEQPKQGLVEIACHIAHVRPIVLL